MEGPVLQIVLPDLFPPLGILLHSPEAPAPICLTAGTVWGEASVPVQPPKSGLLQNLVRKASGQPSRTFQKTLPQKLAAQQHTTTKTITPHFSKRTEPFIPGSVSSDASAHIQLD